MIVTPSPIGLLVVLGVHKVRPIFVSVPLVIVIVLFVMVVARALILGSQRGWRHGDWDGKRGTQQSRIQKTKHKEA